ncbi:MAG: hypothetical protein WCR46_18945, partial [Deltaproteobacteria bacterium]
RFLENRAAHGRPRLDVISPHHRKLPAAAPSMDGLDRRSGGAYVRHTATDPVARHDRPNRRDPAQERRDPRHGQKTRRESD